MSKVVLFSPVGRTDPMPDKNFKDGALLHISRFYHPDIVYLYLTQEMSNIEEFDKRYSKSLALLSKHINKNIEVKLIKTNDYSVQDFNLFYKEFRATINQITQKLDPDDTLLVNISSGTPAMKSCLLVLATLGEINCKLIQVVSPDDNKERISTPKEYDLETYWSLNPDNNEATLVKRCEIQHCPNLKYLEQEKILKNLIKNYNYKAALDLAKDLPTKTTDSFIHLLELARARELLEFKTVDKILKENPELMPCFPVREGTYRKVFEYFLTLHLKSQKKEYTDFLRAITPIVVDLFELVLNNIKVNINMYTQIDYKKTRVWNKKALEASVDADKLAEKILEILKDNNEYNKKSCQIYSYQLHELIKITFNNKELIELATKIRNVESNLRNKAAHEIVSINESIFKQYSQGLTMDQVLKTIQKLIGYTGLKIQNHFWDSYDTMNNIIIDKIKLF